MSERSEESVGLEVCGSVALGVSKVWGSAGMGAWRVWGLGVFWRGNARKKGGQRVQKRGFGSILGAFKARAICLPNPSLSLPLPCDGSVSSLTGELFRVAQLCGQWEVYQLS